MTLSSLKSSEKGKGRMDFLNRFLSNKKAINKVANIAFCVFLIMAMISVLILITPVYSDPAESVIVDRGMSWDKYQNPDGSYTNIISGPKNYNNGTEFVPINTTIESKSVTIATRDYSLGVDKGIYEAYFRPQSSDTKLRPVAMKYGDYILTFSPQSKVSFSPKNPSKSGDVGSKVQSDAVSSTNEVTYPGQYQEIGTANDFANLTYKYQNIRLKEELIIWNQSYLQERFDSQCNQEDYEQVNLVFKQVIRAYKSEDQDAQTMGVYYGSDRTKFKDFGLAVNDEQTTSDEIYFTDENNDTVFYIPQIYAYDSNNSKILINKTVSMTSFGNLRIDLLTPFSWLNDSERVYPVYIDPTTTTVTLTETNIVEDGFLVDGGSRDTTSETLQVGYDGTHVSRGFWEFDTSSIPDAATIGQVILNISESYNAQTDFNFTQIEVPIGDATDANLWADIKNGTVYNKSTISWTPIWAAINLTEGGAEIDLENQLSADWFAVGSLQNDESFDENEMIVDTAEDSGEKYPELIVTYTVSERVGALIITPSDLTSVQNLTKDDLTLIKVNTSCSGANCGEVNTSLYWKVQEDTRLYLDPNENISIEWTGHPSGTSSSFTDIDDGAREPTAGDGSGADYNYSGCDDAATLSAIYGFETATLLQNITKLSLWVYAKSHDTTADFGMRLSTDNATSMLAETKTTLTDTYAWYNVNWTGQFNQSMIDLLAVNLTSYGHDYADGLFVDAVYVRPMYEGEDGGLVSTDINHFLYTNSSNPNVTTLNAGESLAVEFWVNTTAPLGSNFTFWAYSVKASDATISNTTDTWNATSWEAPAPARVGLDLIWPTENVNVTQNEWFNITVNVSCHDANCGEVNVSFDPETVTLTGTDLPFDRYVYWRPDIGDFTIGSIAIDYLYIGFTTVPDEEVDSTVFQFNTSSIPDGSIIDSIILNVTVFTALAGDNITIREIPVDVTSLAAEHLFNETFNDTEYVVNNDSFASTGEKLITLGSSANTDLQNSLSVDRFAFGITKYTDIQGSGRALLYRSSYHDGTDIAQLIVTYTPPKSGLISTVAGTTPFYTNATYNPWNITLDAGESELLIMWVNATGILESKHPFFVYANTTSDMSISNITDTWNVTIVEAAPADSTAPTVNITHPQNTTYTYDIIDLNYTFTETNPGYCSYSYDGGGTNSSPVAMGTNFTSLTSSEGNNTWHLFCNDTTGNLNISSVTFFKDTINPSLNITSPANITYTTNEISINYSVSDTNLQACWYSNDTGTTNHTLTCGNNVSLTWDEGSNTVYMWANDSLGNINNSESVTFYIDSIDPVVTIVSLIPNPAQFTVDTIYFNWTASDLNLDTAYFNVSNSSGSFVISLNTTQNATIDSSIFTSPDDYTFRVWANDSLGNNAITAEVLGVLTVEDSNAPDLTVHAPIAGSYTFSARPTFIVNITANDSASDLGVAWWSTEGIKNNTWEITEDEPNWTTMSWDQTEDTTVNYNVWICVNDTYNNINCSRVEIVSYVNPTGLPEPGGGGGSGGAWTSYVNESSPHDIPDVYFEGPEKPTLIKRIDETINWASYKLFPMFGDKTRKILFWLIIATTILWGPVTGKLTQFSKRIKIREEFR